MTLDRLTPLLAGVLTAAGGLVVWAVFLCAQPDHRPAAPRPPVTGPSGSALRLDGTSALLVPDLGLPDGPFTAECWAACEEPSGTQSLFGNTARGGFEVVWMDESTRHPSPWPTAWVRTERTLTSERPGWTGVPSAEPPLADRRNRNRWVHVALTCDGTRVRLFLNGRIVGDRAVLGAPVPSHAPFFVGADSDADGEAIEPFRGLIDEVRISSCVRYDEAFRPRARLRADAETVLHLTFDDPSSPWLDTGPAQHEVRAVGHPQCWPIE